MNAKDKPPEMTEWEREVLNAGGYTPSAETKLRRDAEILRDQKAEEATGRSEGSATAVEIPDSGEHSAQ